MLKELQIKNFTVFSDVKVPFCRGINVVVGSNGTGKSHLLKLGYSIARWHQEMSANKGNPFYRGQSTQRANLAEKLVNVFQPDSLGRLTRRAPGNQGAWVGATFHGAAKMTTNFKFATNSSSEVTFTKAPQDFLKEECVFFPTKEMLSMFPNFASLYRDYSIAIDETYFDLCLALERPLLKGRRFDEIEKFLRPIEEQLGGAIRNENGRFYLKRPGGNLEVSLVAEGFRKLGTVAYLLANGTLSKQSVLFWDEPETNLNPTYMRKLAISLVELARHQTQIILATHSLFMLRELSLLLEKPENSEISRQFCALGLTDNGASVDFSDSVEDIDPVAALDAEVNQSERFLVS